MYGVLIFLKGWQGTSQCNTFLNMESRKAQGIAIVM